MIGEEHARPPLVPDRNGREPTSWWIARCAYLGVPPDSEVEKSELIQHGNGTEGRPQPKALSGLRPPFHRQIGPKLLLLEKNQDVRPHATDIYCRSSDPPIR